MQSKLHLLKKKNELNLRFYILCYIHALSCHIGKVRIRRAHQGGAYPGSSSIKRPGIFLSPPPPPPPHDGMLVHPRVTPSIKYAGTHLYTWVERGTVGVKCLAQEHKDTTVELTNHEGLGLNSVVYYEPNKAQEYKN